MAGPSTGLRTQQSTDRFSHPQRGLGHTRPPWARQCEQHWFGDIAQDRLIMLGHSCESRKEPRKKGQTEDKHDFSLLFKQSPAFVVTVPMPLGPLCWAGHPPCSCRRFACVLPVPGYPDDVNKVPSASRAQQGSQKTFLMFDGSLQFLFTHFKITEGDHLLPY